MPSSRWCLKCPKKSPDRRTATWSARAASCAPRKSRKSKTAQSWPLPSSITNSSTKNQSCGDGHSCVGTGTLARPSSAARRPSRTLFLGPLYRHTSHSMPAITALLHARNDALRLGRTLETLLPCDEILVMLRSDGSQHGPQDATTRIAREYGAKVVADTTNLTPSQCLHFARHDWILCLDPRESLTESLSLPETTAFSVFLPEETANGCQQNPTPQTRLVPRHWPHWQGLLPAPEPSAIALEGALLRFTLP